MAPNRGTGVSLEGNTWSGSMTFSNDETFFETSTRDIDLKINPSVNKMLRAVASGDDSNGINLVAWDETDKHYLICEHSNAASRRPIRITSNLSTNTAGRASALDGGEVMFLKGIFVGDGLSAIRHMTNDTAAPTSDEHARGEIVWNRNASTGAAFGWVCVTAGTPGTWVELRIVADQTSGAAQAALTDNTGGTPDQALAAVPAGGTGTAAGGWDTAGNRDTAIAAINDNIADLAALVDEMRTTLVGNGMMKGSV